MSPISFYTNKEIQEIQSYKNKEAHKDKRIIVDQETFCKNWSTV
jgi:hypothetical protein